MWVPNEDEAIEMFARHFEARHRSGALRRADETAEHLKANGDDGGHRVWKRVAGRIAELRHPARVQQRRETESV